MKRFGVLALIGLFIGLVSFSVATTPTALGLDDRTQVSGAWAVDTITNTEVDTLTISTNFITNYEGFVGVTITNLSGTSSLTIVVDEGWVDAAGTLRWDLGQDTITTTAAAGTTGVDIGRLAGNRYRIRITGAGVQSTTYRLRYIMKPS